MSAAVYVHCDAAELWERPHRSKRVHANWVLITTILASGLAFLEGSVFNVGLPAIGATFNASSSDLQWAINAYLLPLGALLLLGGRGGGSVWARPPSCRGTACSEAASIGCALAPTLLWLLIGRTVQGVGAAMLMPNSLAILGSAFGGEARGRAIGIWASMGRGDSGGGSGIRGWLIDTVGWRSIFLINLPPAIRRDCIGFVFVRDPRREDDAPPLDLLGGLLATCSLGAITWGLTIGSGHEGWTPMAVLLCLGGIVLMLGFLLSKTPRAKMP